MSQKRSLGGGEKVEFNVFFLTWMHFGRQGLPMELPSDFQEHFYMILTKFEDNIRSLFAKKTKQLRKHVETIYIIILIFLEMEGGYMINHSKYIDPHLLRAW